MTIHIGENIGSTERLYRFVRHILEECEKQNFTNEEIAAIPTQLEKEISNIISRLVKGEKFKSYENRKKDSFIFKSTQEREGVYDIKTNYGIKKMVSLDEYNNQTQLLNDISNQLQFERTRTRKRIKVISVVISTVSIAMIIMLLMLLLNKG